MGTEIRDQYVGTRITKSVYRQFLDKLQEKGIKASDFFREKINKFLIDS